MDGLFAHMRDSGFGCHIAQYFVGGVGFADDFKLLAPSNKGLQNLVYISEDYAQQFDITFNGVKSQFLVFRGRDCKEVTKSQISYQIKYLNVWAMHATVFFSNSLVLSHLNFGILLWGFKCDKLFNYKKKLLEF